MPKRRIAIMGGTFDPVHYGHLLIAEEARTAMSLDDVVFIPNGVPPLQKRHAVSSSTARLEMTQIAVADNPGFSLSSIEIDRDGPSYSIDTVRELRRECEDLGEVFFIIGADAVLDIQLWHRYHDLLKSCRIIAATRPGFNLDTLQERMPHDLFDRVDFLPIPQVDISSTEIRRRVAAGRNIRYLTPDAVVAYIDQHGLYRDSSELSR